MVKKLTPLFGLCVGLLHLAEVDGHFDDTEEAMIRGIFPENLDVSQARVYKELHSYQDFIDALAACIDAPQARCILAHFLALAHVDGDFSFFERALISQFAEKTQQVFDETEEPPTVMSVAETRALLS